MKRRLSQWMCLLICLPLLGQAQLHPQQAATQPSATTAAPAEATFAITDLAVRPAFPGYWLHWEVTGQKPVRYFYIERSSDGGRFALSGGVMAVAGQQAYDFTDLLPEGGAEQFDYRIEVLFTDGTVAHSPTFRLYPQAERQLPLYPTPAETQLWVKLPQTPCEGCQLSLFAEGGKPILRLPVMQPYAERVSLDLSAIQPGRYFLYLETADRRSYLGRFVRQ